MLHEAHRNELRESGISDATIAAAGLYSEYRPRRVSEIVGWSVPFEFCPALVFPFRRADGSNGHFVASSRSSLGIAMATSSSTNSLVVRRAERISHRQQFRQLPTCRHR